MQPSMSLMSGSASGDDGAWAIDAMLKPKP